MNKNDSIVRLLLGQGDIQISNFMLSKIGNEDYLPPLLNDGMSLFAAMFEFPITAQTLLTIFRLKVWILILAIFCICNLCFFLSFDASPSIKNHQRVKTKSKAALWRIVFFDSLVAFQMDWQRGPNLSSRWFLVSLNVLFFFALNVYLIIFSVRILDDRRSLPFHDLKHACVSNSFQEAYAREAVTVLNDFYYLRDLNRSKCVGSLMYVFKNTSHLEMVKNGSWLVVMTTTTGQLHFKDIPHIQRFSKPLLYMPSSFMVGQGFQYAGTFAKIVLKLREAGIIQALKELHLKKLDKVELVLPTPITFSSTWLTFAICVFGVIAGLLLLGLELLIKRLSSL